MNSVVRILRRDLGAQLHTSRNLREPFVVKCVRVFWATVYLFKALRFAAVSMRHEQLGSRVLFEGKECFISNWANSSAPAIAWPWGYRANVPREQLTNIVDAKEMLHRFRFGLGFYMGNWYGADVNEKLYGREWLR